MIPLTIYVAIFVAAFVVIRMGLRRVRARHDFTSLKTVTFGDGSAVRPDRWASVISVMTIFLLWGAFTGSKWVPVHAPGPFVGDTQFTYTVEAPTAHATTPRFSCGFFHSARMSATARQSRATRSPRTM